MDEGKIPKGFEEYKYGIPGYANSNAMLRYFCRPCVKGKNCRINHEIRDAMGENYPYWNDAFVIASREFGFSTLELISSDEDTEEPQQERIPSHVREIMVCKEYQDPQMEFDFGTGRS